MKKKYVSIAVAIIVTLLISSAASAATIAFEADASAYFLGGYSFIFRSTFGNGLSVALGTGKYELPEFIVKDAQANFSAMKWKAESQSIQVARIGYRFSKPYTNGFEVDLIILRQSWKVSSETIGESAKFNTLGIGGSTGYYFHVGKGFYIYPIASFTSNAVSNGVASVQGNRYEVKSPLLSYSVHVGYEF